MTTVTDKYVIREMNEKLVLKTVIQAGTISRAEIAKQLKLNKTSVSSIVSDLIDKDLIVETGSGESSGGRKPILVMFNHQAGYSLSFDVGPDYISSLLTYLDGSFVSDGYLSNAVTSNEALCATLKEAINGYLAQISNSTYGITGICIGLHGIVNEDVLVFSPFYAFDCSQLKKEIESTFNLPVIIENEANLAALGEQKIEPTVSNLVSLSVKYGIGAGVILNGTLYTGTDGHAGEVGHLITAVNGKKCRCGNHGCLEQYASEYHLLQTYKAYLNLDDVRFMRFKQDYLKHEPLAQNVMSQFIQYMAVAVNNLITTFNPEVIIINSRITNQVDGIVDQIKDQLLYKGQGQIVIKASTLDRQATLLGGVHLNTVMFLGF
ncbi:MAG: ROK family transcriptional regulator [Defluviitaleaceae bacterium]|nr:ROK family transcriptional regulator [Defluviitaleaceae bacterium]